MKLNGYFFCALEEKTPNFGFEIPLYKFELLMKLIYVTMGFFSVGANLKKCKKRC